MSAFGSKADMTVCACLLSRSLLGVKRTWFGALHMYANDPKRTFKRPFLSSALSRYDSVSLGGGDEATRGHQAHRGRGGILAVGSTRPAVRRGPPYWRGCERGRGRSGCSGEPRGVQANSATTRLEGRAQSANRFSRGSWRPGTDASVCKRACRAPAPRDFDQKHAGDGCAPEAHTYNPDRLYGGLGPRRRTLRRKPGASGR